MPPTSAPISESGSSDQISDEIESTRSRMDETLDELGDRLNPRRIIDDVMDYFTGPSRSSGAKSSATARVSESASEFGQNLGRTVRDNPVPTVLIGAGLAWLAFGLGHDDSKEDRPRRRSKRDRYFVDEYDDDDEGYMADDDYVLQTGFAEHQHEGNEHELVPPESYMISSKELDDPSMWEKTKQAASGAVDSVTGAAASVGEAIGDATSATASGISSAASSVASSAASGASAAGTATSDAAAAAYRSSRRAGRDAYRYGSRMGRRAGRGVSRQGHNLSESVSDLAAKASDKYQHASELYPLAVGAGCMALGMLAGLVVPRTRREDQWMGKASDDLMDDAYEAGEQLVQRGQRVVSETIDKAAVSADEHGLTGDSLIERGKRVANKVVDAASEALEEEDLTAEHLASDVKSVAKETGAKVSQEGEKAVGDAKAKAAKVDSDVNRM
jgi:hypothetical protein